MATIINLTSGIEVDFAGAVTYIKHGNVKLLKRGTNINIYDDSDDDGNQRGQIYITIKHSEVTSPVTADIDALYTAVKGYIDVSSGGGGTDANAVHVNAANEITAITEKTTVANIDEFIIEDSGASFVKKSIKRKAIVNPITITTASTATLTIDSDVNDFIVVTAQAEALTIAAPTGTPVEGQKVIVRIKDDGSARGITFNAIFRAIGVTLPTTTVASKITYLGLVYNSTDTKWDIVATKTEA
tara:strand:+ start:1736 stop:2464 length:729 start_codon:yes stop_codon:yes gene_type:complete